MSGYQPPKDCARCVYHMDCIKSGKRKKATYWLGYVWCKDFTEKKPKPPTSGSNVQKPEHTIKHIHIDATKEYLQEYKAEIERETKKEVTEQLYKEIEKIIQLLEFTIAIEAESVTIHGEEIPLLLHGLKNNWQKTNG